MELLVKRIDWRRSNVTTGNRENRKKLKTGKQSNGIYEQNINRLTYLITWFYLTCRWFKLETNPHTKQEDWIYTGGYWDRNYENDLDLF